MGGQVRYRTLTRDDLGQMHRSFVEAFSSYQVNMKMSREAFEDRMLHKLNMEFGLSPGVFVGDKLVGFIFQMINKYEGQLSAYNGGTGVIPGHTGHHLATKMYDYIFPKMVERGVKKCVLEVLENNTTAIRAYEKAGFEKTKTFQCLMLKGEQLKSNTSKEHTISRVSRFPLKEYQSLGEVQPGMLDQLSQVQHHLNKEIILEYRDECQLWGYLIFQPDNGRITQLAVDKNARRQGVGTSLIHEAYLLTKRKALSVLNIDSTAVDLIDFFLHQGFIRDLVQYEMQKVW